MEIADLLVVMPRVVGAFELRIFCDGPGFGDDPTSGVGFSHAFLVLMTAVGSAEARVVSRLAAADHQSSPDLPPPPSPNVSAFYL